jgi:hypothetical protein
MRETMADRCSFCGPSSGPFNKVEGLFTVLMCADGQATRGHASGPYPVMTRSEMRARLDLLPSTCSPTWALEQNVASRQPPRHRGHAPAAGRREAGGSHVPGAGAGLAGAPSRGRRDAGRRTAGH